MSDNEELLKNLHTQRIETLGLLAGGIAHDFNNILTGLLGHITYLKTILPAAGSHILSLSALEEGAKKASTLTQEILNFSRLDSSERPDRIDLSDLVRRTFNLLRGAISPEYDLAFTVPEGVVPVLAGEAKLTQVIVNLVINSRDAIKVGGQVRINLEIIQDKKELADAFSTQELSAKRFAKLTVSDNGHGIPAEIQEHIFKPYYSTKKDKGTGLGLAIVHEVVKMYAGVIKLKTGMGKGTSISVYLPVLEDSSKDTFTNSSNEKDANLMRGNERILVVDDEYPVRNVLSLSLEHLGYNVEIASSGTEALELYRKSKQPIDLVILDMLMPQLSGDQTFFKLKAIDPDVKVLVISGYSSQEAVNSILDNGGLGFVQKPFTITELAKRVRECFSWKED